MDSAVNDTPSVSIGRTSTPVTLLILCFLSLGAFPFHADAANCGPGPLGCGDAVLCSLNTAETDTFTFSSGAGAYESIHVVGISGTFAAGALVKLRVQGPGVDIETCQHLAQFESPFGGEFTVQVSACHVGNGGDYTISRQVISDHSSNCATPLSCLANFSEEFSLPGEVDAYSFVGFAGQTLTFTALTPPGASSGVTTRVYSPAGEQIARICRVSGETGAEVTLETTGLYTFLTSNCIVPEVTEYSVELEAPCDCP